VDKFAGITATEVERAQVSGTHSTRSKVVIGIPSPLPTLARVGGGVRRSGDRGVASKEMKAGQSDWVRADTAFEFEL
jgi:hypothetical protein